MRNIYGEYELDLKPEQQEAYKRLGDRFDQVHQAARDLGMEWSSLCDEGLMDEALNYIVDGDVNHLIESLGSGLRETWSVGRYEDDRGDDTPEVGESAASGQGPGTGEVGASDAPHQAPGTWRQQLQRRREEGRRRLRRGRPT